MKKLEQLDHAVFTRERYFPSGGKAPLLYVCNLCLPVKLRMSKYKNLSKHRAKYHEDVDSSLPTLAPPLRGSELSYMKYSRTATDKLSSN